MWFWTHFVVLLKSDLDVQPTQLRGQFIEPKLMLSFSFRYGQFHKCQRYEFNHTLPWYLSLTKMFNRGLTSSFRCDQIHKSQTYDFNHGLPWYLSLTYMFNKLTSDPSSSNTALIYGYHLKIRKKVRLPNFRFQLNKEGMSKFT